MQRRAVGALGILFFATSCGARSEPLGIAGAGDEPRAAAGGSSGGVGASGASGVGNTEPMEPPPSSPSGVRECLSDGEVGPDARWVALNDADGTSSRLVRVGVEGVTCPEPAPVMEPVVRWAVDGSALSSCGHVTRGPGAVIPFIDDRPGEPIVLTDACTAHAWSPTRPILAMCERLLSRCVIAEIVDRRVETSNVPLPSGAEPGSITWSPRGDRFVVTVSEEPDAAAYLVDATAPAAVTLMTDSGAFLGRTCVWSPSGNSLACEVPMFPDSCGLAAVDAGSSSPRVVEIPGAPCTVFSWVNDRWLLYSDETLWAAELRDGVPQTPLAVNNQSVFHQWQTTEGYLAAAGSCAGRMGLCVTAFSETGPEGPRLIHRGAVEFPSWSPDGQYITFLVTSPESRHLIHRDGGASTLLAPEEAQVFWSHSAEWLQLRVSGNAFERQALHVPTMTRHVLANGSDASSVELATFADDLEMVVVPVTRGETSDTLLAVGIIRGAEISDRTVTRVNGRYHLASIRPRPR